MRRIDSDEHLLPLPIIEIWTDENTLPFVQQTGVQVESTFWQFQYAKSNTFAERQEAIAECGFESELYVITFFSGGVYYDRRVAAQWHCGALLTGMAVEAIWTRAVEFMLVFIDQIRIALAVIQTGTSQATEKE